MSRKKIKKRYSKTTETAIVGLRSINSIRCLNRIVYEKTKRREKYLKRLKIISRELLKLELSDLSDEISILKQQDFKREQDVLKNGNKKITKELLILSELSSQIKHRKGLV